MWHSNVILLNDIKKGRINCELAMLVMYIYIVFLLRVLSSLLPLRSVERSNFDKGLHCSITLIKKRHKIMIEMKLLCYIYIYI